MAGTSKIEVLLERIQHRYEQEHAHSGFARFQHWLVRWCLMLYREFIRDDVKVRAESLAYLMIFSLLPIIAGSFFIFTIFSRFGMVQEAIGHFVDGLLDTFPDEQRDIIEEYVVQFKDAYWSGVGKKSGTLGIFALFFLFWVGLQAFNNIDRTVNHIWSSDRERPFLQKARNFVVISVVAPIVLIASLSVPIILRKVAVTSALLSSVPFLGTTIDFIVPVALVLGTFTAIYQFVPVCRVERRSALWGGVFAAALLQLANFLMNIYFRLGTSSAYGKAAVVPLVGFWFYVVWVIIIMGAEVSYLVQNEPYYLAQGHRTPSVFEAESMLTALHSLSASFSRGETPINLEQLHRQTHIDMETLRRITRYLEQKELLLHVVHRGDTDNYFTLAKDVGTLRVSELLQDYLVHQRSRVAGNSAKADFERSLEHWANYFGTKTFAEYAQLTQS
ncbi:MAG: YihY/virulence factor BrkB family protein [Bdellovibrionales bacterium]|nr:YihY/virulence factor BrkB family protein [Bdellovibrionales bacterium]